ncbi:MAG TPA: hypothetical protein VIU11_00345 [Nakamurella sp.]
MAARSGVGLASVITAVTLAISGSSGTTVVSGDGSIAVSSAVTVQICEGCPPAADRDLQAQQIIDVLDDVFAGVPGLPGRLALEIPARFGSRLLLMHF